MKNYTFITLIVACVIVQYASSMPDKSPDLMDRVKAKAQEAIEYAQEAMERAQDAASRAVESAKVAAHEAMESAREARQHGMETGQEWIEYGKSVAASFSNHTADEKTGKQPE